MLPPMLLLLLASLGVQAQTSPLKIAGMSLTPHVRANGMRFRRDLGEADGALVRLFVLNLGTWSLRVDEVRFDGRTPDELVAAGEWAWHNLPRYQEEGQGELAPGDITVWTFNTRATGWGAGRTVEVSVREMDLFDGSERRQTFPVELKASWVWISAATFLSSDGGVQPDTLLLHLENHSDGPVRLAGVCLHLPESGATYRLLRLRRRLTAMETFPTNGVIPAGDQGGARIATGKLPLTYTAMEVLLEDSNGEPFSVWAHLRIKREAFDISGGWVAGEARGGGSTLQHEAFLQALKRLYINTGHMGEVPGYTDQTGPDGLYTRYPLKFFHALQPLERWDTEAMLPRIHAAEWLGEPQYGGGRPVPPQEVFDKLSVLATSRIATTLTLSDESSWRYYAGLSDYPHYDAYRVTAPSADSWQLYERWGETRIRWGAPLETIGAMCRSLRELSRPAPIAYWSQGAHAGWDVYDGRLRTSPTPDELRLQAYHALASRITSLYWFNLSLRSLVRFPDLLDPIARIGREIRLLEDFYLEGAAYRYRQLTRDGRLDWDLASLASKRGALLFALDLDYAPDPQEKVFRFGPPRDAVLPFDLPAYLRRPMDVFRIDADGVYDVDWETTTTGVEIRDRQHKVAIYVATLSPGLRAQLQEKRRTLIAWEEALGFDPASEEDLERLRVLLPE